ncbi:hypothetical protein B0T14DRAFT_570333 [Immersiella caudata]|uniref:Uncharacterized protein n=1 Tax=Immersiella caudata TaxID=314043 RepID=A0AA39WFD9_9PEZI|nr:hypothetical protein B0T14DRAFT_570333 [Immersiella caudata]
MKTRPNHGNKAFEDVLLMLEDPSQVFSFLGMPDSGGEKAPGSDVDRGIDDQDSEPPRKRARRVEIADGDGFPASQAPTTFWLASQILALASPVFRTELQVICMGPRCIPETLLDLQIGEVPTLRNAGGNFRHALRDITIMDELFGLESLLIIRHTDYGTLQFTEQWMSDRVKGRVGEKDWVIVESVKGDVEWVRAPVDQGEGEEGVSEFRV